MMSIQSVASSVSLMSQSAQSMTDTQKQELEEVLNSYDTENLTDDDAVSLVSEIKDLGISAGKDLTSALASAGLDARELADQAGLSGTGGPGGSGGPGGPGGGKGGPGGPGGPGGAGGGQSASGPDSAAVQTLQSVVEQLQETYSEEDSEEDFTTLLLQELEAAGLDTSEPILDFRV